mmetsp:Transcript_9221/g.13661  ORF Transcript_9221/g.13661 Transcript_9221/m.13661 type:complete len:149 (+) Transcript_9221:2069-2515(+)
MGNSMTSNKTETKKGPKEESAEAYKKRLTKLQYSVARNKGTEPSFKNEYWDNKKQGTYYCVCCKTPLFYSKHKYNSGTGWPSFYDSVSPENVGYNVDKTYGMVRTEVLCSQCNAHLGHRFEDGPSDKTGMRYCINSASLAFEEDKEEH